MAIQCMCTCIYPYTRTLYTIHTGAYAIVLTLPSQVHIYYVQSIIIIITPLSILLFHNHIDSQLDILLQVNLSVVHATTSTATEYESVISSEEKV